MLRASPRFLFFLATDDNVHMQNSIQFIYEFKRPASNSSS